MAKPNKTTKQSASLTECPKCGSEEIYVIYSRRIKYKPLKSDVVMAKCGDYNIGCTQKLYYYPATGKVTIRT